MDILRFVAPWTDFRRSSIQRQGVHRTVLRPSLFLSCLIGLLLGVLPRSSLACTFTECDSGYVRVAESCSVQENVITYSTVKHNHWASGGTFTISGTAQTGNSWLVGASAGYETSTSVTLKAAVLASVTAAGKVQVAVNGNYSGNASHTWTVSDSVTKQSCKCPVYKEWVSKPTEVARHVIGRYWNYCNTPEDDHDLRISESVDGTATGDEGNQSGVVSYYSFTQNTNPCNDCYGTSGDCPGAP